MRIYVADTMGNLFSQCITLDFSNFSNLYLINLFYTKLPEDYYDSDTESNYNSTVEEYTSPNNSFYDVNWGTYSGYTKTAEKPVKLLWFEHENENIQNGSCDSIKLKYLN
jgi:hypothetical protein